MFQRTPKEIFKKKLENFLLNFQPNKLPESKKTAFKNLFLKLDPTDRNNIQSNLKALTSHEACATPEMKIAIPGFAILFGTLSLLFLQIQKYQKYSKPEVSDSIGVAALVTLLLIFVYGLKFSNNYDNKHLKEANEAALKIMQEAESELAETAARKNASLYLYD